MCKYDILYKYILFSVLEIEEFLMRLLSHLTLKVSTSQNSETHSSSLSSYFQYWKIRVICHFSENCKISISLSIVKFNADGIYSAKDLMTSSRMLSKQSFLNNVFYFITALGFNDCFLKFCSVALTVSGIDEIIFKMA